MSGRFPLAALALLLAVLGFSLGCGNQINVKLEPPAPADQGEPKKPSVPLAQNTGQPPIVPAGGPEPRNFPPDIKPDVPFDLPAAAPQLTDQEKYDAELLHALSQISDGKLTDALASLEAARSIQDNEQVKLEIAKLKQRIEQEAAAEQSVLDISAVLGDGRADEASRLAASALLQFGGTSSAPALLKIKRQADALTAAQTDDAAARKKRFHDEAQTALQEKNLRAAAVALEQALAAGADPDLSRQLDMVRAALTKYDDFRQRAAEFRRDPSTLEDAIAAYQDAAREWDTPEVRADIDQCQLALQKRRDRVSVADFEVRGDVGIPDAGREIAEELLPAFKVRYDLAERAQVAKVIEELNLQASDLTDDGPGRQEIAKLAKVRYLVLGSISTVGGITVHARLVDVKTGLVVQTAKVVAPEPDEVVKLMPQLANLLMMTDEERLAYEKQLADQMAKAAPPPPPPAVIPPAPEFVANQPPPPPIIAFNPRPVDLGGVKFEDFGRLPAPPPPGQVQPVIIAQPPPFQDRMLAVSVELGDNLFRRGRFREAFAHFEFAMNLAPDRHDLRLRVDRCRPLLPPPVRVINVVIGQPVPPPIIVRPRLAVLNFVEIGDPRVVPPGIGAWGAEAIAPYFCPPYETVDRGEVYWWMGRLGMTMHDVMTNPNALRWLGRAMNVRYFVFGCVRQTASFDVHTHLIDAEFGFEIGRGRVHCFNPWEFKLRLCELARQTLLNPAERLAWEQQEQEYLNFLAQGQACFQKNDFAVAITFFEKARRCRPNCVQVQVLIQDCNRRLEVIRIEDLRRREWERQQAIAAEMQRRQWELAQATETARLRVRIGGDGFKLDVTLQKQRTVAYDQMCSQARVALGNNDFKLSIQLFESALAMNPNDDGFRELALARAKAAQQAQVIAAQQVALREQALRAQREKELAAAKAQLERERLQREQAEAARLKAQQEREDGEYQRCLDAAERLMAKEEYRDAVFHLQRARRLKRTDAVERMLSQALAGQARAAAEKKGDAEKQALLKQLDEEKTKREAAEKEAAKNRELYEAALKQGQEALAAKKYDTAIVQYTAAKKVFQTDEVLTGLRQAEAGKARETARAEEEKKKAAEEAKKKDEAKRLVGVGQAALAAKKFDEATKAFNEANKLVPGDVDALAGLSKAEQMRDEAVARARREKEEKERDQTFQTLLASGKASLLAKKYDAAITSLSEAVKLKPEDKDAKAALADAEKALSADAAAKAAAEKKARDYQKLMTQGRVAMNSKRYDDAEAAFSEAQKLLPDDKASADLLKEARKAKGDASAALAAEAKKKEEETKKASALKKAVADAKAALAVKDLAAAGKALDTASELTPRDAEVIRLQQDLAKARDLAKADADAKKKRMEQYQGLLEIGRKAMAAKEYDQAAKVFADAARLMPDEKTAADLLKQAEKSRDEAKTQADEEKQKKIQTLLNQGRTALAARKLDDAAQFFGEAEKLAPRSPLVEKAMKDLDQARKDMAGDAEKAKKQAAYQDAVKSARAAIQAGRYKEAVSSAEDALKLFPGDKDATALLQSAQKAMNDADAEAKKKAQVNRLLTTGQQMMNQKKYDEALAAAKDALQIMPGDKDATALLQAAQKAQADARANDDAAKKKAEYTRAMTAGQQALNQKKFGEAIKAAQDALALVPNDKDATALLKAAQKGQQDRKQEEEQVQQRQAQYAKAMTQAQQAMNQKRFDDAVKLAGDALKLVPGDKEATALLQAAQKADAAANAEARKKEEEQKRQAQYTRLITQAQQAMAQKKFDVALDAYAEALKLMPNDRDALRGQQDARKALDAVKNPQPAQPDYATLMKQGQQAMAQKKFDQAIDAFSQALKLKPNDRDAARALKDAQDAKKAKP